MARKRKGRLINGVILVDKYTGESSNRILQQVKRIYGAAKAGHTGALDPLATGMLPICLGEATKFSQFLLDADKTYLTTATLGIRTDTSDSDGEVVQTSNVSVSRIDIENVLNAFRGLISQVPSMFSALKHNGKPLYHYARQGIEIERPARNIRIYDLVLLDFDGTHLNLKVRCSKGTYIRTLVDDIGQALGCGAHVSMLRRTQVARYPAEKMVSIEALQQLSERAKSNTCDDSRLIDYSELDAYLMPMDTPVLALPKLCVSESQMSDFQMGRQIKIDRKIIGENGMVRVYEANQDQFLGVGSVEQNLDFLQPKRVVVYPSKEM